MIGIWSYGLALASNHIFGVIPRLASSYIICFKPPTKSFTDYLIILLYCGCLVKDTDSVLIPWILKPSLSHYLPKPVCIFTSVLYPACFAVI
jgi:hypothetical protein